MREKLPAIGKAPSLLLLVGTIAVMVTAKPVLPGKVTTIVKGYKHVE